MMRQSVTMYGHYFRWNSRTEKWETSSGRVVYITPPTEDDEMWYVEVPSTGINQPVAGQYAENRAFTIAEAYSRQKD